MHGTPFNNSFISAYPGELVIDNNVLGFQKAINEHPVQGYPIGQSLLGWYWDQPAYNITGSQMMPS